MKKFRKVISTILAFVMIAAIGFGITGKAMFVEATSATTYTRTTNSDGLVIRSQDGYVPQDTYDRIGLTKPQDMVLDTYNGVEYLYILNQNGKNSYISRINLNKDSMSNNESEIEKISLSQLTPNLSSPTGLWIQTVTVNEKDKVTGTITKNTRKEIYIADKTAKYTDPTYGRDFTGLIYKIPFEEGTNNLSISKASIIHRPTEVGTIKTTDSETGEVSTSQGLIDTPSFGETTEFAPIKVAVDTAGNIFIASEGTAAGMIELTYSGEFVSFFVVNTVEYNFLYQLVKKIGTEEQLKRLNVDNPASYFNVFIDNNDLVYSTTKEIAKVFDKYSTAGSSVLETAVKFPNTTESELTLSDCYVTDQGLIFISISNGMIYIFSPDGQLIFFFGTKQGSEVLTPDIVGFFDKLEAIVVDSKNRIWAIDSQNSFLQTFVTTDYSASIFNAITYFNEQKYEESQQAWEQVLKYDSLSVLANDGLGKAYYYAGDYASSLEYFKTSKNRNLYSNVFWELRNDYLQQNLSFILIGLIGLVIVIVVLKYLFNNVEKFKAFKVKAARIKETRVYKDLTVGFRIIKKPTDTLYELKVGRRGSVLGATIHYILAIIAMILNTYCYALPFQTITINTMSVSTVLFGTIAVLFVFILCNYLVSAINDGEGTFKDIYKFTGYSLLPMIICLPLGVAISYGLTLNEQVVISFLKTIAFWGSGILLVIGILETHNYTFGQTIKNVLLTIVFMLLFAIICIVVFVMVDQIATLIESVWKEVKLRAGWY